MCAEWLWIAETPIRPRGKEDGAERSGSIHVAVSILAEIGDDVRGDAVPIGRDTRHPSVGLGRSRGLGIHCERREDVRNRRVGI
jgi:hypothetical protein